MEISVVCQKCRKAEKINIHDTNIREISLLGSTNIAIYHMDHMLLLNIDRYGIRSQNICDPSSAMVYGVNVYVGKYFLIRQPLIPKKLEIVLLDRKRKIIDARLISNYMYAISLARFVQKNKDIKSNNIHNIYGVRYLIGGNGNILLAVPLVDVTEGIAEKWVDYISTCVNEIPLETRVVLDLFQKFRVY